MDKENHDIAEENISTGKDSLYSYFIIGNDMVPSPGYTKTF
jgi:hypothetical protein